MDRLSVFQRNDTEISRVRVVRKRDNAPMPNATIGLYLASNWRREHVETPFTLNIGTLAEDLLLEIARGLQR
jgi:hypothetical protein